MKGSLPVGQESTHAAAPSFATTFFCQTSFVIVHAKTQIDVFSW